MTTFTAKSWIATDPNSCVDAMREIVAAAASKEEARQWVIAATNDMGAEIDGGYVYAHNHWLDNDELRDLAAKINAGV